MTGYEVRVLRDPGAVQLLRAEWDQLADRCGLGFASRPSYGLTWFSALGKGELAVTRVTRDGRLVALAPLHRRSVLGQDVLRWLGHGLGTIGEVLAVDADAAAALWDHLATQAATLQLTHVRLDDVATLALRRHRQWQVELTVDDRVPLVELPPGSTAATLRSKRSLTRLARYRNALADQGRAFEVELVDDVEGLRARWDDVARVAAAADQGRGRTDLCAAPWDRFTRELLEQEAQAGRLLLVGSVVGGRWASHEVGLRVGGVLHLWLSRFDPELRSFAPGHLLAEHMVDRSAELGLTGLDMGLGENDYKLAWAGTGYDVGTVTAFPVGSSSVRARAVLAGAGLRGRLRRS